MKRLDSKKDIIRIKQCPECFVIFHRDKMAVHDIAIIARDAIKFGTRPKCFTPDAKTKKPARKKGTKTKQQQPSQNKTTKKQQ